MPTLATKRVESQNLFYTETLWRMKHGRESSAADWRH